jgi:hypothetical protein
MGKLCKSSGMVQGGRMVGGEGEKKGITMIGSSDDENE